MLTGVFNHHRDATIRVAQQKHLRPAIANVGNAPNQTGARPLIGPDGLIGDQHRKVRNDPITRAHVDAHGFPPIRRIAPNDSGGLKLPRRLFEKTDRLAEAGILARQLFGLAEANFQLLNFPLGSFQLFHQFSSGNDCG